LLEADYAQLLHRAIGQLPPQRQRIYRMSREDELSYEEIAGSLGLSRHTVKAQMVKALDYLRRYVQVRAGISVAVHLWGLCLCGWLP
jgi:RNA polymerase sigma-70 factor (ECF subfamily)